MSSLFNIMKITVDARKLRARVLVNPGMPLMTSEDIEATARVYYLAPAIAKHVCLGDAGREFQDCMGNTELAHLLEHLSVEIMNETGLAGDISCGRTRGVAGDDRLFEIELSCPDDVLAIGALSSASFMMEWAFLHPEATAPDFPGTVEALRQMVLALRGEAEGAPLPDVPEVLEVGKSRTVREGGDVALLAFGRMVGQVRAAAELLSAEGIECRVVDMRWVKPLDAEAIAAAAACRLVVTVEEGVIAGGAGEGVLEVLARQGATTPAVTLGIPDRFIGQGPVPQLFADLGLNAEGIAATVREALG